MAKKYDYKEEVPNIASEPIEAYRIDTTHKTNSVNEMPCTYSDEEFKKEIALSEKSGFVSDEDFKKSCFEKWGIAL